jgi:hypothetical protein
MELLPRRKRVAITNGQRAALRAHKRENPHLTNSILAEWYHEQFGHRPSKGTISESLNAKFARLDTLPLHGNGNSSSSSNMTAQQKKARASQWPDLEEALFAWYKQRHHDDSNVFVTGDEWRRMAFVFWACLDVYEGLTAPRFSDGWLDKFKKRHGVRQRYRHGGMAGSVDEMAAIRVAAAALL